jgi:drug/metabolite transporter (DMT)-like permease
MNWLNVVVSALGLIAAIVLLVAVLRLRRVAVGGAIADNLPLVILGIISFAGAALLSWIANFLDIESAQAQAALGAQVLVVIGMSFFAAYFLRVQRALSGYLSSAKRVLAKLDASAGAEQRG